MNHSQRFTSALLAVATLAAAPLAAQAADWQSVASACVPTSPNAMDQTTVPANGSFVRAKPALGPNPPALNFVCNVDAPSAGPLSTWAKMRLDFVDTFGGQVSATLYAKSKLGGGVALAAQIVSTAGLGVRTATVAAPQLNFSTHFYHVVLSLQPQPATQPQVHAVALVE